MNRLSRVLLSLPVVAVVLFSAGVSAADKKSKSSSLKKGLENGSTITLRTKKPSSVAGILGQLEKQTGCRVETVSPFGSRDANVASQKISVAFKKTPFWEAIAKIQEESGLKLHSMKGGVLRLAEKANDFAQRNIEGLSAPVVKGAFRLRPTFESFFKRVEVEVLQEPRIGSVSVEATKAKLVDASGETKDLKFRDVFSGESVHTGFFRIVLEPEGFGNKIESVDDFKELQFAAKLRVGLDSKEAQTPPLGSCLARPVKVGGAVIDIAGYANRRNNFVVEVRVHEGSLPASDVVLVSSSGEELKSRGHSSLTDGVAKKSTYTFNFPKQKKRPKGLKVGSKKVPLKGKHVVPVSKLGVASVRVTDVIRNKESGSIDVKLKIEGGSVSPDDIVAKLGSKTIEGNGWQMSKSFGVLHVTRSFDPAALGKNVKKARLVLNLPTKTETVTVKSTFSLSGKSSGKSGKTRKKKKSRKKS
ncbi:MAG: hypothetical protein AAF517_01445 [Planctomycetota bacterium]